MLRGRLPNLLSNIFAGDLAPLGGPVVSDRLSGYVRAEQMRLVKRNSSGLMLANICNAVVLMVAVIGSADAVVAQAWCGLVIVVAGFYGWRSRFSRRITPPQTVSRLATQRLCASAFLLGSLWAVVPAVFFPAAAHSTQLVMTCIVAGMLAGGALAFATLPIAAIAFIGPLLLGAMTCIVRIGDFTYALVAILLAAYTVVLLRSVVLHALEFTQRVVQRVEAETAVRHDALTHLPNRIAFNEGLRLAQSRLDLTGHAFAVLLLDLDHFKEVNDQFGHPVGDDYLAQIAARLRRSTRDIDMLARIGGDEFALVAADIDSADAAFAIARQVCDVFAEPFLVEGHLLTGSVSVGIALAPRDGAEPNELIRHADVALYRAKKAGPCSIRFFEPGDDKTARDNQELLRDLEGAVARNELFLVYQPILHLADDRITAFEALLRWDHPQRGLIGPSQFIGLAEESGLIHAIGDWVIQQACADLACWPADIRMAVNFSVAQLQSASVLPGVLRALAQSGIAPSRLEIEITESMLISKYATAGTTLNALLELGVTVALDDFGTGFSSLTYLRKLPFSHIKIDQSFVADMLVQPDSAAIVKSVLSLASDMKIGVVAEGIETAEQLAYFKGTACEAAQGYFIGKPMRAAQASALLGVVTKSSSQAA
ncbi:MAG: hypothetical protein JWR73_792 [Tardiphaga sp.]|nr:hypothetical protein [Tardiphaga sp.]